VTASQGGVLNRKRFKKGTTGKVAIAIEIWQKMPVPFFSS